MKGLAVAGIPFAQIHRDKQPGYQQSAATQQDGSDLQISAEITTRQSVCAVLDALVKTGKASSCHIIVPCHVLHLVHVLIVAQRPFPLQFVKRRPQGL